MDYAALRAELDTPPYAGLTDAECAARLAEVASARVVPMRVSDFANWLAARGLLRRVSDARTHANDVIGSAALLLMWKIQGDPAKLVDPADPMIAGMFQAFVAAGIVPEETPAAFLADCSVPVTRGGAIGWPAVTAADVTHARSLT